MMQSYDVKKLLSVIEQKNWFKSPTRMWSIQVVAAVVGFLRYKQAEEVTKKKQAECDHDSAYYMSYSCEFCPDCAQNLREEEL